MASFSAHLDGEQDGRCKALHYADKTFERCDDGTQRLGHDYCYNCWLDLRSVGMETFPPLDGGRETRVAIAQTTIFELSSTQMREYQEAGADPVGRNSPGILVKTQPMASSWAQKDGEHARRGGTFAVYAIRAADGSVYIGQTRNEPAHRFDAHARGEGSKYLRDRGVLGTGPIWSTQVTSRQLALEVEQTAKNLIERLGFRVSVGEPDQADRIQTYAV